ncbi:MAG: CDP-diacylglycerol--glycerol-3-phosphate 3-phosphatidyltransferase [Planctomycetia bacterium]
MVTEPATDSAKPVEFFTLANNLTTARLLLSAVLFVLLAFHWWHVGLAVFLVAVSTDWFDGWAARRYGQVSSLGRMYDPLVDKVMVCGAFLFLQDVPAAGVYAWMNTVMVSREFLVTGLRGWLEEQGVAFGADLFGKLKMFLQSTALGVVLWNLGTTTPPYFLLVLQTILVWSAVAATAGSGVNYLARATAFLRRRS